VLVVGCCVVLLLAARCSLLHGAFGTIKQGRNGPQS